MTTTAEAPFLQEIARQPHDWTPRLIFADWLEEQGDARSRLIRLSYDLTCEHCEQRVEKELELQKLRQDQVPWPTPQLSKFAKVERDPKGNQALEMVLIPPGHFQRGSPVSERRRMNSEALHAVELTKGFWLSRFAITQMLYGVMMRRKPSRFNTRATGVESTGGFPVESITWEDAQEFCRKLTKLNRQSLPKGWEYSLPTDAQWEYACRAGTTTATAFGNQLSQQDANCHNVYQAGPNRRGMSRPVEVGSYSPNAWGLHDMHGNVWEWCLDYFLPSGYVGGVDPVADAAGVFRVLRGGGFRSVDVDCRSAVRSFMEQTTGDDAVGFRIVLVEVA